jgi:soluble lytic murein transglycosylase-like protein
MKLTALSLIILITFGCNPKSSLQSFQKSNPKVTSNIQYVWPEVKRFVDTHALHALINSAAMKHGVSAAFVKSIVAAESNFNPDAVSPRGAVGLMQLMPATAQAYGADPKVPEQNVDAGTQYLKSLLMRYSRYRNGLHRAIAAYNAGPAIVDRYRGVPPYRETRGYVARVLVYLRQYQKERG